VATTQSLVQYALDQWLSGFNIQSETDCIHCEPMSGSGMLVVGNGVGSVLVVTAFRVAVCAKTELMQTANMHDKNFMMNRRDFIQVVF
jgi:hypothetical protein